MFFKIFKKEIIRKFKQKLTKIKLKTNQKILNQKSEFSKILNHDIKNVLLAQNNCLSLLLDKNLKNLINESEIINQILSSNKFLLEFPDYFFFKTFKKHFSSKINLPQPL